MDEKKDRDKQKNGTTAGPREEGQAGEAAAQQMTRPVVPERKKDKSEQEKKSQDLRFVGLGQDDEGGVEDEGSRSDGGGGKTDEFPEDEEEKRCRQRGQH